MSHRSWLLLLGICCLPRAGSAAPATRSQPITRGVAEAGTCPQLFGDQTRRAVNRTRRQSMVHFVAEQAGGTVIAHASDRWKQPTALQAVGVKLVETSASRQRAVVEVDGQLAARIGCAAGPYRVAVDDSIGRARILRVLRDGLLVEWRAKLRYIDAAGGDRHPDWMMVWGSRYELRLARGPSVIRMPQITILGR